MKTLSKGQEIGLQIKKLQEEVRAIYDEVDAKQSGAPSDTQLAEVRAKNEEIERLEKSFKDTEDWDRMRQEKEEGPRFPAGDDGRAKSISEQFMSDPRIKAAMDEFARNPSTQERYGKSGQVQVKSLITGASSTSGGALVVNDRTNIVDPGVSFRELTIFDIIGRGTTGSDVVEYVRQGTHTNAAAPVAEASATGGGTGTKPESAMVLELVQENVKTVAHWLPATRRALSDAGQLRTLIETFGRYGLMEEMEDQIITGSGSGENFTGVLNVSGTTAQAYDTDILTTTRKARTKVKTTGRARPSAFVMNPADWETIDLLQDNEGRYFYGGPSVIGNPRLWGLPVIECEAMTQGTAMVAPWNMAMLWDREVANILISDSHSDFFIRNIIALLFEQRAAFGVIRPAAFVEIDLTA